MSCHTATKIEKDGKILMIIFSNYISVYSLNLKNMEWTKLHNVYYQRRGHTANVLGNAIYLFGGYDYNDDKI